MATQVLRDDGGLEYASTNSSTPQPHEAILPGDSSRPPFQAADVRAANLPDVSEQLIKDQQKPGEVHAAWFMVQKNYKYCHLVTGEKFTHYSK